MERKSISRELPLQKKAVENRRSRAEHVPDLTDFMNDMFFGTVGSEKKAYNLTGNNKVMDNEEEDFDCSTRSNNGTLTQEWLDEARRMVASSPARGDSPSRLVASPKFVAQPGKLSMSPSLEKRDPLSRSARRHRAVEGFSGEILSKSEKHSRNKSESLDNATDISPAQAVHKWFCNILSPQSSPPPSPTHDDQHQTQSPTLPPTPRQATFRKSRFQVDPAQGISVPPCPPYHDQESNDQLLSPPKKLIESAQRRSISSTTCSFTGNRPLSPPRNLVESAQRRSISKSTCSLDKIASSRGNASGRSKEEDGTHQEISLNEFLKEQRAMIEKVLNGEVNYKAKIVLSDPSNS